MTLIDNKYQEKDEEDLWVLKTALTTWRLHRNARRKIAATRNNTDNTRINGTIINRKQKGEEKQLCGRFKRLISNISLEKTWTWLRKENLKRETESCLIAAQNNATRTSHIKARIDKTQQNRKCWLCGNRNETINHIISECSKLAQKDYKTRLDWVGKVIHWEMCKKLKCYMHNSTSIPENDSLKLCWDFDIQTDHLISARRLVLIIIIIKNK